MFDINTKCEQLKDNPYIKAFLKKNGLNENVIAKKMSPFLDFEESIKKCENCKGLEFCRQAKKGEYISLKYDGIIDTEVTYCDYYLTKLKNDRVLNNFVRNDIPSAYSKLDLNNIELVDGKIASLNSQCLDILEKTRKKGLFIHGNLGVGKTYMCYALANSLAKNNNKVAFVKVNLFVNEMRKLIAIDSEKYDRTIKDIKMVPYLILDDIGAESVSSYSRDDLLFYILDYRMEHKLLTVFTSNLSKDALREHYKYDKKDNSSAIRADRLFERIDILTDDFALTGNNKRRP